MCVVSAVLMAIGDTLLRTWGTQGDAHDEFMFPVVLGLALVGSKVFAFQDDSSRVQVFE